MSILNENKLLAAVLKDISQFLLLLTSCSLLSLSALQLKSHILFCSSDQKFKSVNQFVGFNTADTEVYT